MEGNDYEGKGCHLIYQFYIGSRLLVHPCGVDGAHDFLENSGNLNRQAKGELGQALVPTPTI